MRTRLTRPIGAIVVTSALTACNALVGISDHDVAEAGGASGSSGSAGIAGLAGAGTGGSAGLSGAAGSGAGQAGSAGAAGSGAGQAGSAGIAGSSGQAGTAGSGGNQAGNAGAGGGQAGNAGAGGSQAGNAGAGGSQAGNAGAGGSQAGSAGNAGSGGSQAGSAGSGGSQAGNAGAGGSQAGAGGGGGVCTPTMTRCSSSTQVETCDGTGQWGMPSTCQYVCTANACGGVCAPTDTRCSSNTQKETCGTDGQWGTAQTCQYACSGKTCGGVCIPNTVQCASGVSVETCGTDGQWPATPTSCAYGCGGGACFLADNALTFDGTNDIVTVPYAASLDVTSALTIEAWVYATSAAGGAIASMWGQGGLVDKWLLQLTGGTVTARIVRPGVSGQTTAAATMPLNAWTHVAFTYDGASMLIYLNGAQAGSTAAPGALPGGTNLPFRFGIEDIFNGSSSFLNGRLDELRYWSVARSATQIAASYQSSVSPSSAGLVAYYNFNEALSSQTVTDLTGNGHDGTLGANNGVGSDDPVRAAH